ncbi:cbb3-type cytochrome c oxidase subunit 3 [Rhodobacteraceae bacterium NNCM2]|nr:cbb3-type cytochrome c oxidase subunit 3 [Coraliihabitans acroporae]
MELYSLLRAFADSWMLLAMTLFFIGIVLYTLRPGSRETHDRLASTPLRNDVLPRDTDGKEDSK